MTTEPEVDDSTAGTSPAADSSAPAESAKGAPEVTPASPGDPAESTPPATELDEFKAAVAEATGAEKPAEPESEPEVAEVTAESPDEPAETATEGDESKALSQTEQGKAPEKLTDRPEWQAATKIADKLGKAAGVEMRAIMRGIYKREHELHQQVERAKPAQEVVQEMMASVGGSEQGFTNMRHLIKSFDSDPANAVPMLETLLQDAKQRAGLVIQAPELAAEVETLEQQVRDGLIDPDAADRRKQELLELQQARLVKERSERQATEKRQREAQAQSQARLSAAQKDIQTAAEQWEKEKLANDPDYLPLKSLHTSRTFMLAEAKVAELGRMLTGKEARAVADEALKQVKAEVGKLLPKKVGRQPINGGDGSSGKNRQAPANEFEEFKRAVEDAAARH